MHNLSKADHDALYAGESLVPYMDEQSGGVTWTRHQLRGMGRRRTRGVTRRKATKRRTLTPPKIYGKKIPPKIHGEKIWPLDYNRCPPVYTAGPNQNTHLPSGKGVILVPPYGGGWTGRQPPGLGPGGSGAPCARLTFTPWQARVGEWVTVRTNFDLSGLSGVYIGVHPLQFKMRGKNKFEVRFPHPGNWVTSVSNQALSLGFGSARIVLSNFNATHIVEVRPVYKPGIKGAVASGGTASVSFRPSSWVRWPPGSQASRWGGMGQRSEEIVTSTPRSRGRVNDKTLRRMTRRKTSTVPRCSTGTKPCSWSDANGNIHVGCCQTTQIRT